MANVAISGSTGFIGSHLLKRLEEDKHNIEIISSDMNDWDPIDVTIVYHLGSPASTSAIHGDPMGVMEAIFNNTRRVMAKTPGAIFVNASSMGANFIDPNVDSAQMAYNIAKRLSELYLYFSEKVLYNYRIPSVYGPGMHDDSFIAKATTGIAFKPENPNKKHYIAHVDDVVEALVNLEDIPTEIITLGEIYEEFSSGRRGVYRSTPHT
jgi:nucleoside-diphosphate-sugar epimerase